MYLFFFRSVKMNNTFSAHVDHESTFCKLTQEKLSIASSRSVFRVCCFNVITLRIVYFTHFYLNRMIKKTLHHSVLVLTTRQDNSLIYYFINNDDNSNMSHYS